MEKTRIKTSGFIKLPKVLIETHGCKLNMADSQMLAKKFVENGYSVVSNDDIEPNVFVLNSCTVTHVADRKARNALRKARKKFPNALIVAAGCYVERDENSVKNLDVVDISINNSSKNDIVDRISEHIKTEISLDNQEDFFEKLDLLGRSRASLKIQEGCNQVCSYCIIPKVRGRERSIPVEELINSANDLSDRGVSEIILTGTQLGNYGFDLSDFSLTKMLKVFLDNTSIPRIRVSSLQPLEINENLIEVWIQSKGRLCPHFHLPLQSGSTRILKEMRRKYTKNDFLKVVELIKSSNINANITTDVIVGFPSETEFDHSQTLEVIQKVEFLDVHVFPFSKRPGTSAWYLNDQVNPSIKKYRAKELNSCSSKIKFELMKSYLGSVMPVLWEGENMEIGFTDNYLKVYNDNYSKSDLPNNGIENSKITKFSDGKLYAQKEKK
ncbi:MAG: tRNA (N(6)-L-threonylcarbamoyladenosine(37)-C(2))-methylthiotransferase MtaB [Chloroflexi bacterium]|nr:tRNA (N(6)-L-threonylcarbamoyladenosine(37)-C(2))-methylthiotransferase MtaB [Chloroflexota bacterium]|tara:strand:- start:6394 stop:7716 length:1323 start_codon:yes stop_codon:yes gene_type:complete